MKFVSKLFHPLTTAPKNAKIKHEITSKSQKLLSELGIVQSTSSSGCFAFLPLGIRSLEKLTTLVETKLSKLDAQRVLLPTLASENLWKRSGRLNSSDEFMRLKDRHDRKYILSPTHEELMTEVVAAVSPISNKQLPLRLYQIGNKFRDEMRPRYGIIRCREFIMKDLYTFDMDMKLAQDTYEQVGAVYQEIFAEIGVKYVKVEAPTGMMGGHLSHEYLYEAAIGEDRLQQCQACGSILSGEMLYADENSTEEEDKVPPCTKCGSTKGYNLSMAFEVGHTFLLGTKYSSALSAISVDNSPLYMGCYGLGLSRILGASIEALSSQTELRWPLSIAPFIICIIGPKEGSKEETKAAPWIKIMHQKLCESCADLRNDIIVDDRSYMTIGKRVLQAKRIGYPFILVIGHKATQDSPEYELLDVAKDELFVLNENGIVQKLQEKLIRYKHFPYSVKTSDEFVTENIAN